MILFLAVLLIFSSGTSKFSHSLTKKLHLDLAVTMGAKGAVPLANLLCPLLNMTV